MHKEAEVLEKVYGEQNTLNFSNPSQLMTGSGLRAVLKDKIADHDRTRYKDQGRYFSAGRR
jgi:hypothetical protein